MGRVSSPILRAVSLVSSVGFVMPLTLAAADRAFAEDGPKGIAFVEAPEQGGGVCFGSKPEEAFQCAAAECVESGALDEDCHRIKWCFPAGWSADIFMQHREGPHWHHVLCGWQSEADLEAAVKLACEGSAKAYLSECSVVAKWSPDGTKFELNQ